MSIIKKVNDEEILLADKSIIDHSQLTNRDAYGAHSISAIRKLPEKLTALKNKDTDLQDQLNIEKEERQQADALLDSAINDVETKAKLINIEEIEGTGKIRFTDYGAESSTEIQAGYLPDNDTLTLDDENRMKLNKVYVDAQTLLGNGNSEDTKLSVLAIKDELGVIKPSDIRTIEADVESNESNINLLSDKINALEGTGGYLTPYNFNTSTPSQEELTNIALEQIFDNPEEHNKEEIWNGTRIKNLYDDHVWILNNTPNTNPPIFEWIDDGLDTVKIATNQSLGVVRGNNEQPFKINVDLTGEMSVNNLEPELNQIKSKLNYLILDTEADKLTLTPYEGLLIYVKETNLTYVYQEDDWILNNQFLTIDKEKVELIQSTGDGTKYLSDDGTYKTIIIPEIKIDDKTIIKNDSNELETIAITDGLNIINYNQLYEAITTKWEA